VKISHPFFWDNVLHHWVTVASISRQHSGLIFSQ